eukprot:TRINITY_DN5277_c0_g2_i1.p1 TRINITY_DN5277_c0_g2~~TRINITY_DN5277_c0_g2_i1.p1  ORF type:complete len:661 (+),score=162.86 TRINITY_DN5277_c0_g2_i1:94-1983(+)
MADKDHAVLPEPRRVLDEDGDKEWAILRKWFLRNYRRPFASSIVLSGLHTQTNISESQIKARLSKLRSHYKSDPVLLLLDLEHNFPSQVPDFKDLKKIIGSWDHVESRNRSSNVPELSTAPLPLLPITTAAEPLRKRPRPLKPVDMLEDCVRMVNIVQAISAAVLGYQNYPTANATAQLVPPALSTSRKRTKQIPDEDIGDEPASDEDANFLPPPPAISAVQPELNDLASPQDTAGGAPAADNSLTAVSKRSHAASAQNKLNHGRLSYMAAAAAHAPKAEIRRSSNGAKRRGPVAVRRAPTRSSTSGSRASAAAALEDDGLFDMDNEDDDDDLLFAEMVDAPTQLDDGADEEPERAAKPRVRRAPTATKPRVRKPRGSAEASQRRRGSGRGRAASDSDDLAMDIDEHKQQQNARVSTMCLEWFVENYMSPFCEGVLLRSLADALQASEQIVAGFISGMRRVYRRDPAALLREIKLHSPSASIELPELQEVIRAWQRPVDDEFNMTMAPPAPQPRKRKAPTAAGTGSSAKSSSLQSRVSLSADAEIIEICRGWIIENYLTPYPTAEHLDDLVAVTGVASSHLEKQISALRRAFMDDALVLRTDLENRYGGTGWSPEKVRVLLTTWRRMES